MSRIKLIFSVVFVLLAIVFFSFSVYANSIKVTYSPQGWIWLDVATPYAGHAMILFSLGLASAIACVATIFVPRRFFPN